MGLAERRAFERRLEEGRRDRRGEGAMIGYERRLGEWRSGERVRREENGLREGIRG